MDDFLEIFVHTLIVFLVTLGVTLVISRISDMTPMGLKVASVLTTQIIITAFLGYMLTHISATIQHRDHWVGFYYAVYLGGVMWIFGLVTAVLSAQITVAWLRRR